MPGSGPSSSELFYPTQLQGLLFPWQRAGRAPRPHAWRRSHSPPPARWHLRQHVAKGNVRISGLLGVRGCSKHRAAPGQGKADSEGSSDHGNEPCLASRIPSPRPRKVSWVPVPPVQSRSTQGCQSQMGLHCPYMGLPNTAQEDRVWPRDVSPDWSYGAAAVPTGLPPLSLVGG